jgi:hypothetical protein
VNADELHAHDLDERRILHAAIADERRGRALRRAAATTSTRPPS